MPLRNDKDLSNIGKKWSIDEDKQLEQEIASNKSYEEIAVEHKRTILGIKLRIISHIIYPKYKDDIEVNINEITTVYNIENELIMRHINKLKNNSNNPKPEPKLKTGKKELIEYLQQLDIKITDVNTKLDILLNQGK